MHLSQLRTLIAVADTGSISGAAERLGLTQSGASQAISALEDHLEIRLLTRGHRGAHLTAAGEDVVHHARAVMGSMEAIRKTADATRGLEQGRVCLASFPSTFTTLLPPLLRRFRELHPGIDVVALEASDQEIETWLAEGSIDLAVVMDPLADQEDAPMGQDDWVAVVPNGHTLARHKQHPLPFARLTAEPFILATGGCLTHARSLAADLGLELEDVRMEVKDYNSTFALVREGLGVTLVPEPTLPLDTRGLSVRRLEEPLHRRFGLQACRTKPVTPAVQAFLEAATQVYPRQRDTVSIAAE